MQKQRKKWQHRILAIERMSTHTSCSCLHLSVPTVLYVLTVYLRLQPSILCVSAYSLLTVCLCVCVCVCVLACLCNRALVGPEWFWSIHGRHSHPGLLDSTLCVCVCVCVCPGGRLAAGVATAGTRPPLHPPSPTLSESTMGDPVKQYRPRNKALYRASDTLSLKEKHSKTLGGWNRNRKLISNPPPLYSLPVTPLEANGVTLPRGRNCHTVHFSFVKLLILFLNSRVSQFCLAGWSQETKQPCQ